MVCPECANPNPDGARFCLNCGARLERASSMGRETRLESYLPKGMLAKLEAARAGRSMRGERRIVTMLFCDVVGSTAMAEKLDPEEWTEIMNGAYENLIAPVYRYEGTLARLMGDAIFAFFGAPIAHEDDPQRAVAAGVEIVEGIRAYRERMKADHDLDLNVRVGINTGPVVVGEVGSDLRLEYTAMGDAVNVAARMEQTAEPGTVQITAETQRLVAPYFEIASRGAVEVKGKAEPVQVYRVVARNARLGPMFRGRVAPLVGREREMTELRRAIDETLDGRGQVVSLIAEAGLGKSRLIEEVQDHWDRHRPQTQDDVWHLSRMWQYWQCVSYDTARPYAQYRRNVARIAGVHDTDPPEVVRTKLARIIQDSGEWLEPHMRVWRSLFGVGEPGEDLLEGEEFKRAITDLVVGSTRFFGSEPRLLVFEDLHWCDEAYMDLLIETAKLVDELPCLFLVSFRPDRRAPSWRLKQWLETEYPHRSAEIVLSPLTDEESGVLIDELLPERDHSDAVRTQIIERTEGNPLFVEELAAAVIEQGSDPENDLTIPTTLQALITARLDTLDDATRRTLQLASVIGRSFPEPVLRAVTAGGDDLDQHLRTLERAGLITETARIPQREYAFHHSLTQESTYSTILLRTRRALHRQVGEVFEELYSDRIEEFASLLARHFQEAGDDDRTLRYATLAGDHAAKLYANADAVTHYTNAIDAARRLERSEEQLRLFPSRGRAFELAGRYDDAVANDESWRALAEHAGDGSAVLGADLALATLFSTPTPKFDAERGRALSERTLDLARQLGDRVAESKTLWNLMILNVYGGGDLHEAVDAGERSLAIARELNAREQMAFTLNDLWRPYVAIGGLGASRASLEEARGLWRELRNLPMLSENLASSAAVARLAGNDQHALALAEEAHAIAQDIGNLWGQAYSLMNIYGICVDRGELGRAIAMMRECIAIAEPAGFIPPQATTRAELAYVHAYLGDLEGAHELVRVALDVARERMQIAVPWVMGAKSELHLLAGELDQAEGAVGGSQVELLPDPLRSEAFIHVALVRGRIALARDEHARAVEIADTILHQLRRLDVRHLAADALLLKGRSLASAGKADEAKRVLGEARSEAERREHRRVLWEVLHELSEILDVQGNTEAARELRAEARRLVEGI
ncbi:MAG TPA: adenylate/guanylate cyclase domain-containing protein, partial [Actinomycetota bacterium]